jgi:hypothetical protein
MKLVASLLLLAMVLAASVCLAQSDNQEQVWHPPYWVWGSGYTLSDHPSSVVGPVYDPFDYYSYQGKTYYPYRYSYYHYPGSTWYPYRYYYWYPYNYYSNYWWYW